MCDAEARRPAALPWGCAQGNFVPLATPISRSGISFTFTFCPPFLSLPTQGISDAYRHIIRAFLVHFHANIMRHSTKRFDYRGGSVGNFFFAGARIFFR